MKYDEKLSILDEYICAINTRNDAILVKLFDDEVVIEDPVGTPPHIGKEQALHFYQNVVFPAKPSFKRLGTVCAAQTYALMACQAETAEFTLDVIEKFEFHEGRIKSMQAYFGDDNFTFK